MYNNRGNPIELIEFQYQRLFGLSYQQVSREPVDKLFMNLRIYAYLQDKAEADEKMQRQ